MVFRGNPWITELNKHHTVICIRKTNHIAFFFFFVDKVRPKTPPVSISDMQKVGKWRRAWVCMHTWIFLHKRKSSKVSFCPTCVTLSRLKKKRRTCRRVRGSPSLWATLSTRRPSTKRIWGKRWSSWCWIRRRASLLLMVSSTRVSTDSPAQCRLVGHVTVVPAASVYASYSAILCSIIVFPIPLTCRRAGGLGEGAAAGASGVRGGGRVRQQRRPVGSRDREDAAGRRRLDFLLGDSRTVMWPRMDE